MRRNKFARDAINGTRATRRQRRVHGNARVCLFVLRWGEWPPWSALLLRTMEHNPSIRFLLLGDHKPLTHRWHSNVAFHEQSLRQVLERARSALGVSVSKELASVSGGASKISDLKPMLAHLYPELLRLPNVARPCDYCARSSPRTPTHPLTLYRAFVEPSSTRPLSPLRLCVQGATTRKINSSAI